jgi:hypothetical protein
VEHINTDKSLQNDYNTAYGHYKAAYQALKPIFTEMAAD